MSFRGNWGGGVQLGARWREQGEASERNHRGSGGSGTRRRV